MSLRALKTISIKINMTNLKHLRYLDCSYSRMSALPEATTILYSLQTLKLFCCANLRRLPEGMRYMSSLRHIFLVGCYRLERMPQGTGQLSSLQTLTNYVIDSDPGRGIDQLKDLDLGGALSLTELRKVHSVENAKQGNMSAKHNLKRLSLSWANRPPYGYEVDTNAEGILEALCPNKRLEVLLLSNYTGAKLSSWMHNSTVLEHLSELCLSSCKNCKDLPPLWQLPSLRYLSLNGLHSLTSICAGNDHTNIGESCISLPPFFPKLEIMIVSDMIKLERWHQEVPGQVPAISFPQLKKLDVSACPMLASMPKTLPLIEDLLVTGANDIPLYHLMNMSVQSNLECKGYIEVGWRLIHLHFSRLGDSNVRLGLRGLRENVEHFEEELSRIPCRFIKVLDITNYDCLFSFELSQVQQNIWDHFGFVEKLSIENCNNIVQWPAVEFRNMNCLRVLNLIDCSNLTGSLPLAISDEENDHLPRLQNLSISCCNNLVEVPKLPASLESLSIRCCPKLVSMPRNLGSVKKLRELSLIRCDALTAFPDGTYGVTALRTLVMEWCPRVETLPEGLLQQLPTLGRLRITGCPNLEEAFSSRGTHWNFVEAIPNRSVGKSMR
nr:putative disease resistance protein At3g14460 isoform X1 [Aegilops tauschii subsp. strangulata]